MRGDRSFYSQEKKIDQQSGMVLVLTILILALLSLLVLSQMQLVLIASKSFNQFKERQQLFYDLEEELGKLVPRVEYLLEPSCTISERDPNELLELLKNNQTCRLRRGEQEFVYLIEDLGLFPCLQIQIEQKKHSSRHLRLSIHSEKVYSGLLQVRLALPGKLAHCGRKLARTVKAGLLSWSYIN